MKKKEIKSFEYSKMGTAIIINRHKIICSNDSNVGFGKKKN